MVPKDCELNKFQSYIDNPPGTIGSACTGRLLQTVPHLRPEAVNPSRDQRLWSDIRKLSWRCSQFVPLEQCLILGLRQSTRAGTNGCGATSENCRGAQPSPRTVAPPR